MTFVPKALRSPNGKGDKDRTADREAYRKNFDKIDWSDTGKKEPKVVQLSLPLMCSDVSPSCKFCKERGACPGGFTET